MGILPSPVGFGVGIGGALDGFVWRWGGDCWRFIILYNYAGRALAAIACFVRCRKLVYSRFCRTTLVARRRLASCGIHWGGTVIGRRYAG